MLDYKWVNSELLDATGRLLEPLELIRTCSKVLPVHELLEAKSYLPVLLGSTRLDSVIFRTPFLAHAAEKS